MYYRRTVAHTEGGKATEDLLLAGHLSSLSLCPATMPSHGTKCYLASGGTLPIPKYPIRETAFRRTARLLQAATEDEEATWARDAVPLQPMQVGAFQSWPHVPSPEWMKHALVIEKLEGMAVSEDMAVSVGNLKGKRKLSE